MRALPNTDISSSLNQNEIAKLAGASRTIVSRIRTIVLIFSGVALPLSSTLAFHLARSSRYKHVMARCREKMPPVTHLDDTRWLRCYLFEK